MMDFMLNRGPDNLLKSDVFTCVKKQIENDEIEGPK